MATGSNDTTIKVWDLETNECVKTLNEHGGILKYSLFFFKLRPHDDKF